MHVTCRALVPLGAFALHGLTEACFCRGLSLGKVHGEDVRRAHATLPTVDSLAAPDAGDGGRMRNEQL